MLLTVSSGLPNGSGLNVMFMTENQDAIRPLKRLNTRVIKRALRFLKKDI